MNVKKFNKTIQKIRKDVMLRYRDFSEVVKYLGGRIENGNGSSRKLYLNNKIITIHVHSENDFITRETWKLMGLR
jgi:hypothetical protein